MKPSMMRTWLASVLFHESLGYFVVLEEGHYPGLDSTGKYFVRTVKGYCGLHVIPFSRGLWVEFDSFLYQFPAPFMSASVGRYTKGRYKPLASAQ